MSPTDRKFALPQPIAEKLRTVQRLMKGVGLVTAAVAALAVLLGAMTVAMAVDYLATLYDSAWRSVLTGSALALSVVTLAGWVLLVWRRSNQLGRVAREVDRRVPHLEERWSTVTALAEPAASGSHTDGGVHPAMFRHVATQAADGERHVEPGDVVSLGGVVKAFLALNAVTLVLVLAAVADWRQTSVLLARFWAPGANISANQIEARPGDTVVGRGEPLVVTASLEGPQIEEAMLMLRGEDEPQDRITLIPREGGDLLSVSHRFRSVDESFAYRLRGGDGQTPWHEVTVADRPEIEAVRLVITPPEYRHEPTKRVAKLPRRLSAVSGSRFELAIKPKAPLRSLELRLGDELGSVSLEAGEDGWHRWSTELTTSLKLTPILIEPNGLPLRRPPTTRLHVYPDRPPVVRIISPDDFVAVTPNDTIEIDFVVEDDNGVGAAELVVMQAPVEPGGEPIELETMPIDLGEATGQKRVRGRTRLDMSSYPLVEGASLSYAIRASEHRSPEVVAAANKTSEVAPPKPAAESTAQQDAADEAEAAEEPAGGRAAVARSGDPQNTPSENTTAESGDDSGEGAPQPPAEPGAPTESGDDTRTAVVSQDAATPSEPGGDPTLANQNQPGAAATATNTPRTGSPSNNTPGGRAATSSANANRNADTSANRSGQTDNSATAPTGGRPASPANAASSAADATPAPNPETAANPNVASSANEDGGPEESTSKPSEQGTTPPPQATGDASEQENRTVESEQRSIVAVSDEPTEDPFEEPNANEPSNDEPNTNESSGAESNTADPNAAAPAANDSASQPNTATPQAPNNGGRNQTGARAGNTGRSRSGGGNRSANPQTMANQSNGGQRANAQNNPMTRRMLDVGQSASSNAMQVTVDKFAGSFAGQQRAKLEIAIAPELDALERLFTRASKLSRSVLDELRGGGSWQARHHRDVSSADATLKQAQQVARRLQGRTHNTPYAFIGLQIADISAANVTPARDYFWKSLQSEGAEREQQIRSGWQQVEQALDRLASLSSKFQRTRREYALADATERINKMYRVFVEDTFARPLGPNGDGAGPFARKKVEFDLDEEYLARLKEVLEMRRELQAELAKILAEDPRLLRRFMNNFREGQVSLRNDLIELRDLQESLTREGQVWSSVDAAKRPAALAVLLRRRVSDARDLAVDAGELADRYEAWMPLEASEATGPVKDGLDEANALAADARELALDAERLAATSGDEVIAEPLMERGRALYQRMRGFEVVLRRLGAEESMSGEVNFVINRLTETRKLITRTSSWSRRMSELVKGNFHRAAAVEQYELATQTDELAGRMAEEVESELGQLLEIAGGEASSAITTKARELLSTLDEQATPNQMAAAIALEREQWSRVTQRQGAAVEALAKAEQLYDELMKMAIDELDKLPVQDPLEEDDPTLDEILAALERERGIEDILGIPRRPSNLQVIRDWLRPGGGGANGLAGANAYRMLAWKMQREQRRMNRAARLAQQKALQRIAAARTVDKQAKGGGKRAKSVPWNVLVSQLDDDLLQGRDKLPPEQFRAAIQQYRTILNQVASEEPAGR